MLDSIIIGSGPAGLSCALTLKIRNKEFLWFGSNNLSNKVEKAIKIKNYPGLIDVSGKQMQEVFTRQMETNGLTLINKMVNAIYNMGDYYVVSANNETYETRTLVLATGVVNNKPLVGEEENLGRGVSYCATCDGFLYKNKNIIVLFYDNNFLEDVNYLSGLVNKIYLVPMVKDYTLKKDNIEVILSTPLEITKGDKMHLITKDRDVEGECIFVLKNAISPSTLLYGLNMDGNHVITNRKQETNLKGVYACGDITGLPYQYAKAVGEGNVCAFSIMEYLTSIKD